MKQTLFFVVLALSGCVPRIFTPALNAPLLGQAHEGQVAVQMGFTADASNPYPPSFQLQGAYAATDHIAVIGELAGILGNRTLSWPTGDSAVAQVSGELGAGYFLGGGRHGSHFRFEMFSGVGGGFGREEVEVVRNLDSSYKVKLSGKLARVFVQPELGVVSSNVEFGTSLRLGYARFWYDKLVCLTSDVSPPSAHVEGYIGITPVVFVRVGGQALKVEMQSGFSLNNSSLLGNGQIESIFVTLGVRGRLGNRFL